MKRFVMLFCLLSTMSINGQTTKTYTGGFVMAGKHLPGEVTYNYRNGEDGERIREGEFSFKGRYAYTKDDVTVQGTYKNGVKEGKWTTKMIRDKTGVLPQNPETNIDALKGEGTSIMSGDFMNGLREGEWVFLSGKHTDPISKTSIKSVANFSMGLLNGAFAYDLDDPGIAQWHFSLSAIGSFAEGLIDGKWVIIIRTYNRVEYIRTLVFDKGKLLSSKLIDTSTGTAAKDWDAERYERLMDDKPEQFKMGLYRVFEPFNEPIAQAFFPWLGDPTLERLDYLHNMSSEIIPGFVYR